MKKVVHIVDDDGSFRATTARLLGTAGYDVIQHETAEDLLRKLTPASAPTCLLLDVRMPGVSGPELQERLIELGASIPVIFLTGYGDIPTTVRAMKHGAEDFLTKPVEAKHLFDSIERAIARHLFTMSEHDRLTALNLLVGTLTPREKEVFGEVVRGRQNKQIAFDLGTTIRTIKAHRQRVMMKLNARSVLDLVSIARTLGLLPPNPSGERLPN